MTTVAQAYVQIVPSARGFGRALDGQIGPDAERSGRTAGRVLGQALSTEAAQAAVRAANSGIIAARKREADAAGAARVAELKLQELRDSGKAKASQIASAEEALAKATRNSAAAASATAKAQGELARAQARLKEAGESAARSQQTLAVETGKLEKTSSRMSGIWGALGGIAKTGALAITAAGVFGAKAGIETAAGMEQARISFATMLGSGQKAEAFLKQLADFAAKTPFEFPELQTAAKSLVSAGFSADKVIPIMRTLGDVTSGMGTGSEGVKRATIALQQMSAAGKITGEDLNQLRDAGVPVFDLLAAATGKSKEAIADLAAKGKLGKKEMEQLFDALGSGKGLERFNGLMEKQSQSLSGLWSTFTDTLNVGLGQAIEPLIPMLKDGLGGAIQFLAEWLPMVGTGIQSAVTWFQSLGSSTAGASSSFSGIVTAVRGFIDVALPIVQQFTDGMRQRLEPMMPMIQSIFGTIGEIVSAAMTFVQTVIQQVTTVISYVWNNWGQGIMNVLGVVFGSLAGIVQGALNVVKGIIQTVTAIIKGDWSGAWEGIKGIVSGAWQAITSAVSGAAGTLFEIVKGIPPKIVEALSGLRDKLWSVGEQMIQGLIGGIKQMAANVAQAARDVVTNAINAAKSVLGIGSPSKVFMEIGGFAGAGLRIGLENSGDRVAGAARSLALSAAGAARVRLASAGVAAAPSFPSTVILRVGDREFASYVDERATATLSSVGRAAVRRG